MPVSTLNAAAAAATEPEIDINGAKYKSDKKEQQIQVFFNQEFFKILTYQTLFSLGNITVFDKIDYGIFKDRTFAEF